ncbi:MAG: cation transporter dimerization domain-containing protein, partial [Sulfuricurvum sp.]|nr:cation transporter dimerization domain-containing protein [Sulfuricurvum sp.]
LDAALEPRSFAKSNTILNWQLDISSHHDLRTRQSGSEIYISVHVVFSISTSLYDAHMVGDKIELAFKNLFPGNTVYSLIHLDPYDDSEELNLH